MIDNKTKEEGVEPQLIVVTLNARLQPVDRGYMFEDPLDEILAKESLGEVCGGGSFLLSNGEVEGCDIELMIKDTTEKTLESIKFMFECLGTPKGSKIKVAATNTEIAVGDYEGLAIYLNGTDLDDEVYENCHPNHVADELNRLTKGTGELYSHWIGPTETAFYMYGSSFSQMRSQISELVENYPLCQKCRIEQIA